MGTFDHAQLRTAFTGDAELGYKLRGLTARVRIALPDAPFDVLVEDGRVEDLTMASGEADVTISAPHEFWPQAFSAPLPPPGYESMTAGLARGVKVTGDFHAHVAAYQGAWQRMFILLREAVCGPTPRRPAPHVPRETDTAVGRYRYIEANGEEARIYYEEAGTGPVPLLLGPTAGADGRQYRYLLANPEMQRRFRMIAYDLPYHGKSLPPIGARWWEGPYKPTRDWIMNWVVAIADALDLDQPFFMGCSVGGQLALDLAAFHADRFGAFISLNGWYDQPPRSKVINNDMFRTPSVSEDFPMSIILGGTSPNAPEVSAQEVYWIYRSNFPGVYAGDNDYFMHEHDLKIDGHLIDARAKPVYVIAGEYDSSAHDQEHGGPAVQARIPGSVFIEAEGLGHFAPSEDPVGFAATILPILDQILARTSRTTTE